MKKHPFRFIQVGVWLGWQGLLLLALMSRVQAGGSEQPQLSPPLPPSEPVPTTPEPEASPTPASVSESKAAPVIPVPVPEVPPTPAIVKTPSLVPVLLNWKQWSQPYTSQEAICKERGVNVICLSPEMAQRSRWNTPSLATQVDRDR